MEDKKEIKVEGKEHAFAGLIIFFLIFVVPIAALALGISVRIFLWAAGLRTLW